MQGAHGSIAPCLYEWLRYACILFIWPDEEDLEKFDQFLIVTRNRRQVASVQLFTRIRSTHVA